MDSGSGETGEFGFTVLGPVSVEFAGQERTVPGTMRRGLLAALLLNANRCVTTTRLEALLWDHAPCSAVANLRNYVADLRRVLGTRLESAPGGYLLRTRPGELDLERFRSHLGAARALWADGDGPGALRHYAQARQLCGSGSRSDLPEGSSLRRQLEALDESAVVAAQEEIAIQLELGHGRDAIERARAVLDVHPTQERAWCLLMSALYRQGDVAGALAAYRSAGQALRAHLGVEPGLGLVSLHGRMLDRDPTLELDAVRNEARAAPSTAALRPNQLPHRNLGFVARDAELAQLAGLMRSPGQVAVVHGPAAVGKTALVLEWATRHESRFPDGVLYADLGATGRGADPRAVLTGFVRAMGWPHDVADCSVGEVSGLYRSLLATRSALVVLDGVADDEGALPLLPGCGPSMVVLTSRSALPGVRARVGASRLALDPLRDLVGALGGWHSAGRRGGGRPVRMSSTPAPGVAG